MRCSLLSLVAVMGLVLAFSSPALAKDNEGRGIVQSTDFPAKSFVIYTQGKTNVMLTLKYTDETKFELDKQPSKPEDVLKEKTLVRVRFESGSKDTVSSVTRTTEKPKEGEKKD